MTDYKIVSFDPGKVTGVAAGTFSDTDPLTVDLVSVMQYPDIRDNADLFRETLVDHVVAEVFELRTDNEFAADLTGVRVEGILDFAFEGNITWRSRTKKSQVPDDLLRAHNLWVTGDDVNWEDGRDANDAIIHMLGFVAFDLKHKPTLRKYFRPNYGQVELR